MSRKIRIICMVLIVVFIGVTILSIILSAAYAKGGDYPRNETVYVDTDEYGTPLSMISSVYISNTDKADTLEDNAELSDIKNLLSNEAPKTDGTKFTFNAEGEDICYQGTASGELPFTIEIGYKLNGKSVTAQEIAGQSGTVEIDIKTTNRLKNNVEVDGEEVVLYTPFSIIGMVTFDESCKDVASPEAKISNQAGTVVALTMLFPGLAESLSDESIDDNNIASKLNESATITCTAENFELQSMTFIVMNGIVNENDIEDVNDVQDLIDGIDEINDAADELYKGAKKIRNGVDEYRDGIKEYTDGVNDIRDGTDKLNDGAKNYADGAAKYAEGVITLNENYDKMLAGLQTQVNAYVGSESADPNAAAMLSGILSTLESMQSGLVNIESGAVNISGGAATLKSSIDTLNDGVKELDDSSDELTDGIDDIYDGINELTSGLKEMRDEGLQEMVDETQSMNVSLSRKDALMELSDAYTSFSALESGPDDSVQFIVTTKEIIAEKPIETGESANTDSSAQDAAQTEQGNWLSNAWNAVVAWFKKLFGKA